MSLYICDFRKRPRSLQTRSFLSSVEDSKKSVATRRVGEAHELASDLLDPAIDLAVAVRRFVLTERAIDIRRNLLPLIFPLE